MRNKQRKAFFYGLLFCLLSVASVAEAGPALGDYDADGLSDFSAVTKEGRNTVWKVRLSRGGERIYTFGVPGDALVQGKFWGDGNVYPAVVFVSDASKPLDWYIKRPDGSNFYMTYGLPGDSIPTQGDLDCDGITDLAVVRNGRDGFKRWFIRASASNYQVVEELFGLNTDRAAIIDTTGDNCAEKVVIRGDFNWFAQSFRQGFFSQVQWGLPGDYPLLPQDVSGDGSLDYVIVRSTGVTQTAYIRHADGTGGTLPLPALSDAVPFLGNFVTYNHAGFAWWQRNQNLAAQLLQDLRTPFIFGFGSSSAALVRPDGTVVQPSENGRLGASASSGSTGGGGGNSGGSNSGSGSFRCDSNMSFKGGNVWNPGATKGRKIVLRSEFYGRTSSITAYDEDGNVFERGDIYGSPEEGGRFRAYFRNSAGDFPRPTIFVAVKDGRHYCVKASEPTRKLR